MGLTACLEKLLIDPLRLVRVSPDSPGVGFSNKKSSLALCDFLPSLLRIPIYLIFQIKNPCSSRGLTTSSRLEQLLIDPLRLGFPNKSSSLPPSWFPVSPTKIPSLCFIRFPFICVSPNKNLFGSLMKKLAQFALAHRFPFFLTEIRFFMHCGSLLPSSFCKIYFTNQLWCSITRISAVLSTGMVGNSWTIDRKGRCNCLMKYEKENM